MKARQESIHQGSVAIRAALHVHARTGRGRKYLLSGLLICGACHGKYVITGPGTYGCSTALYRGGMVCGNDLKVSRYLAETRLARAEADRTRVQAELRRLEGTTLEPPLMLPLGVFDRFQAVVTNLPTVLQRDVDKTRGLLADLLGKEIPLHPTADGHVRFLTAELTGDYGALVRLTPDQNKFGCGGRI